MGNDLPGAGSLYIFMDVGCVRRVGHAVTKCAFGEYDEERYYSHPGRSLLHEFEVRGTPRPLHSIWRQVCHVGGQK
jgi:hypothetical protein